MPCVSLVAVVVSLKVERIQEAFRSAEGRALRFIATKAGGMPSSDCNSDDVGSGSPLVIQVSNARETNSGP